MACELKPSRYRAGPRVEHRPLTIRIIGTRVPSVDDVALIVDELAHLDPSVEDRSGSELQLTVTVLANSDAEARAYLDRALEARTRDWIATWVYMTR